MKETQKEIQDEMVSLEPIVEWLDSRCHKFYQDRKEKLQTLMEKLGIEEFLSDTGNILNVKIVKQWKKDPESLNVFMKKYSKQFLPKKLELMKKRYKETKYENEVRQRYWGLHRLNWEIEQREELLVNIRSKLEQNSVIN